MGIWTDLLLVLFLVFETWCGWRSGLLWQVASLAAVGFGLVLGAALAPALGLRLLGRVTGDPFQAQLLAFLFVAGVVGCALRLLALWAEAKSEHGVARKERERRRREDRILGGMFGALKGGVLALVAVAAGVGLAPGSAAWQSSRLAVPFATAGARLLPEGAVHELRAWLASSKEHFCQGLQIRVAPEGQDSPRGKPNSAAPGAARAAP